MFYTDKIIIKRHFLFQELRKLLPGSACLATYICTSHVTISTNQIAFLRYQLQQVEFENVAYSMPKHCHSSFSLQNLFKGCHVLFLARLAGFVAVSNSSYVILIIKSGYCCRRVQQWDTRDICRQFPPNIIAHLKDECPSDALRAQNLAGGHFLGHEIHLVFVSLSI